MSELVAWGVVVLDVERGNRPVALDPGVVAQRRLDKELAEAAARIEFLSSLHGVSDRLSVQYEQAKWRAGNGSEYFDDPAVVNARLDHVVAAAETEILAAQPGGPRDEAQLNRSLERDTAALDRGVVKRTLYRATVRDNAVTGEYVRAMSARGTAPRAQYRTLVAPFERAIVVDRKTAFVSNHLVAGAPEHAAWVITDRAMVAYIVAEFEAKWDRADVWHGDLRARGRAAGVGQVEGLRGPEAVRTTLRQREILRDIVAGRAQQVTAKRLGIGLRTLGNEIQELKDLFEASSLPELTFKWALSPDRTVDDSAPADAGGLPVTTAGAVRAETAA